MVDEGAGGQRKKKELSADDDDDERGVVAAVINEITCVCGLVGETHAHTRVRT